jgi:signal transduction histidine kinase
MSRTKPTLTPKNAEFEALAKLFNFNVLLLNGDTELKFSSVDAHKLFGAVDTDQLFRDWRIFFERLNLPDIRQLDKNSKPLRLRVDLHTSATTRLLRIEVYPLRHDDCDCYMMLLKDRRELDGLDQQLVFSSHHQIQQIATSKLVHDLNAPINTMRITLELVDRIAAKDDVDRSDDFLVKWKRYKGILSEELENLKNQIAHIPNAFAVTQQKERSVFDLRRTVEDASRSLKHETTAKQIRRELILPRNPVSVLGRPQDLNLALLNAVSMLMEITRQGGALHVEVATTDDAALILMRCDAKPFHRDVANNYEDLPFAANQTGIEMIVVRLVVEEHGGELSFVETADSNSVSIQISLPLHNPNIR